MHYIKKQRNKPLYKKILPLRKNIQNRNKLLKFKKKKWQKFQQLISKLRKKRFYDPVSYFIFNFQNFFNRKFKYNLQNKQRLSFYYGKLRKSYLKKLVRSIFNEFKHGNSHATILFIEKLESRLDTALYRAYFSYSFNNARQLISHKKVYVNGKIVQQNSYLLKKGDLVTVNKDMFELIYSNIFLSKNWSIPPQHFYVNYKTLQILVIEDIRYTNCLRYYNFWIDFSSFLQFYKKSYKFMYLIKNNKFDKQSIEKNIQNRNKLLKFKKKKWQKFQQLISKLRKKIFNFQNFFNRKLGKSYLKKLVRSILNELQFRFQKNKLKCTLKISNKKNNKWLFFWVNLSLLLLTIDSYGNTTFFVECQADSWPLVIDNETSPNTEIFESAAIPEQLNNVVQRNSHSSWIPREIVVTNTESSEVSLIGDETFANDAVFEFDVLWEYLQSDLRLPSQFTETNKVLVYSTIEGSNPNCLIMLEEIWARVGIETVNFETGVANFNINNPSITGLWEIPFSRSRALSLFIGKVFLTELVCYDRHSNQSIVQHTCSFYEALIKGYYIDFEVSASGHNIGEFEKGIFWAVQWRYLTTGQDPHAIIREHFDTMFKGFSYLYWY